MFVAVAITDFDRSFEETTREHKTVTTLESVPGILHICYYIKKPSVFVFLSKSTYCQASWL